jgi:hypothetical protein
VAANHSGAEGRADFLCEHRNGAERNFSDQGRQLFFLIEQLFSSDADKPSSGLESTTAVTGSSSTNRRPDSNKQAGQISRVGSPEIFAPHFSQTLLAVFICWLGHLPLN